MFLLSGHLWKWVNHKDKDVFEKVTKYCLTALDEKTEVSEYQHLFLDIKRVSRRRQSCDHINLDCTDYLSLLHEHICYQPTAQVWTVNRNTNKALD